VKLARTVLVALACGLPLPLVYLFFHGPLSPEWGAKLGLVGRAEPYPNLPFGNPSGAGETDKNNWLVKHPEFALSFNESKGTANWVSWRLTGADLGSAERKSNFVHDPLLPRDIDQPGQVRYANSGFDLGHLCPHGDREKTVASSYSTFVITNVVPQAPNLNRITWEHFEAHIRKRVAAGAVAYIAAGPEGEGGVGEKGPAKSLRGVTVPARCWKVVQFVPGGCVSVIMPNRQDVEPNWTGYLVKVADVEKLTGYKFNLKDDQP
jgi:endonuclease G